MQSEVVVRTLAVYIASVHVVLAGSHVTDRSTAQFMKNN